MENQLKRYKQTGLQEIGHLLLLIQRRNEYINQANEYLNPEIRDRLPSDIADVSAYFYDMMEFVNEEISKLLQLQ